ncbi:hypothetical protein P9112_001874 [Eukaryota sp. TZLM1-RC]
MLKVLPFLSVLLLLVCSHAHVVPYLVSSNLEGVLVLEKLQPLQGYFDPTPVDRFDFSSSYGLGWTKDAFFGHVTYNVTQNKKYPDHTATFRFHSTHSSNRPVVDRQAVLTYSAEHIGCMLFPHAADKSVKIYLGYELFKLPYLNTINSVDESKPPSYFFNIRNQYKEALILRKVESRELSRSFFPGYVKPEDSEVAWYREEPFPVSFTVHYETEETGIGFLFSAVLEGGRYYAHITKLSDDLSYHSISTKRDSVKDDTVTLRVIFVVGPEARY